jgi:hypothetical protein
VNHMHFEINAFLEQRQFDHVEIVTDGKSMKLEHAKLSCKVGINLLCTRCSGVAVNNPAA